MVQATFDATGSSRRSVNQLRRPTKRSKRRKRAPIGTDHYEIARGFIDSWIEELEVATFRRLSEEHPEWTSASLHAGYIITDYDDGRWIWVSVAMKLTFVIEKKTGQIFAVEDLRIDRKTAYGYVRWWHAFGWSTVPPRRI
jgi:hypothetical protein